MLAVAATLALIPTIAVAQTVADTPSDQVGKEDKPIVLAPEDRPTSRPKGAKDRDEDAIEVTGSRLSNGDPTTHVIVLTRQDIDRRGVTSVEDLVRTLPQNLATIGPITNNRRRGPLTNGNNSTPSPLTTLGVSAANLGGIGAGNTLILVNGRRMAGAAGLEAGFVNLNGIPLSAVERVEISQGGASAIYGADAMGGVINFILKKGYSGLTLTGQYENSNNGADRLRVSGYFGKTWSSGSLSFTADYSRTDPIENAKTGYVTEDYSSRYGGDQSYNLRSFSRGLQPGLIDTSDFARDPVTGEPDYTNYVRQAITPRAGLTTRPTLNDFTTITPASAREYIARYAGPRSHAISATFNLDQDVTSRLHFFANGLINRTTNSQQQDLADGMNIPIAPGQYYNPFPAGYFNGFTPNIYVSYFPAAEIADGSLVAGTISNRATNWSINGGLTYRFGRDTKLNLIYTRSRSSSSARSSALGSLVSFQEDPTSPNGLSCYNFDLDSPTSTLSARELAARRAAFDRQCRALTSSDPSIAFNPWRSPSFTGGGSIQDFLFDNGYETPSSTSEMVEARLNGALLTLPGGKVQYAVGGEYAKDGLSSKTVDTLTGGSQSRDRFAFFGEANIPLVGGDFTLPLVRSLLVNVALRNDTYRTTGAVGTVNNVPVSDGGQFIFRRNEFGRFTPAYGFRWEPTGGVTLQGRWTTGFKAPPYTQLFSPSGTTAITTRIVSDPLFNNQTYIVPAVAGPNPDLRPQTSSSQAFTLSWVPQDVLRGLRLNVTYNHTKINNEYASSRDLNQLLPQNTIYGISLFYPRDASGRITEARFLTYNLIGSDYKSITYELSYDIPTANFGYFEPSVTVVQNINAERRTLPGAPVIEQVGYVLGPDRYRIMGQLAWSKGAWNATLLGYYTPSYLNDYSVYRAAGIIANPDAQDRVSPYTTFDLSVSWQATRAAKLSLVGRNIFDAQPPFALVDARPYDTARYNVAGRTLSAQLSYSF